MLGSHARPANTSVLRWTYVHFGRAIRARAHDGLDWCLWIKNECCVHWIAMNGAGLASRTADPLPTNLPRLYARALRQYQKLLDLKRLTSKDKVSNFAHPISSIHYTFARPDLLNWATGLSCLRCLGTYFEFTYCDDNFMYIVSVSNSTGILVVCSNLTLNHE